MNAHVHSGYRHEIQIARRPLISPWVYTHAGFAAFVLFIADLMTGRL